MIVVVTSDQAGEVARTLAVGLQQRVAAGEQPAAELPALLRSLHQDSRGQDQDARGQSQADGAGGAEDGAMSLRCAAAVLGLSERTVRRRVAVGALSARREGRRLLFDRDEIDRYKREAS